MNNIGLSFLIGDSVVTQWFLPLFWGGHEQKEFLESEMRSVSFNVATEEAMLVKSAYEALVGTANAPLHGAYKYLALAMAKQLLMHVDDDEQEQQEEVVVEVEEEEDD